MLEVSLPEPGLLFFSFLFRADLFSPEQIQSLVEADFGPTLKLSPQVNPLIDYYAKEMGEASELQRIFLVPTASYPRELLLSTKLLALSWEKKCSENSQRRVNADVGFISHENFLLATTKNYSHRIYLGQGIYADLTYQFTDGAFRPLPWCYPDYQDQEKIDFLTWCRSWLFVNKDA
jgi:hypothetical protein